VDVGEAIADGPSIMSYLKETTAESGIDQHIRYRTRWWPAGWSMTATVDLRSRRTRRSRDQLLVLFATTGYYNYDEGYSPEFAIGGLPGHDRAPSTGQRTRLPGQKSSLSASGATAVTLFPPWHAGAGHVTMLQRSPTYIARCPTSTVRR